MKNTKKDTSKDSASPKEITTATGDVPASTATAVVLVEDTNVVSSSPSCTVLTTKVDAPPQTKEQGPAAPKPTIPIDSFQWLYVRVLTGPTIKDVTCAPNKYNKVEQYKSILSIDGVCPSGKIITMQIWENQGGAVINFYKNFFT